jgi:hypothetical protein
MVQAITQFFLAHHNVVLPGIGQLKAERLDARYEATSKTMHPTGYNFQWIPVNDPNLESPQPLMAFLSRNNQWTEEESFEAMHAFGKEVKTAIEEKGEWCWPGLGKLVSLNNENFGFVPDAFYGKAYEQIPAIQFFKSGQPHQLLVGDKETTTVDMQEALMDDEMASEGKWWIPGLILGLVTLGLIVARVMGYL